MVTILGKKYITDKECAQRYGYSQEWFKKNRSLKKEPPYIKIGGKILYELDEIDKWFKDHMKRSIDLI